ncbi:Uracil-DNA glycosylase [Jannaschia faecimaris]|uniref:Uracil-DNA glycosylase n=1 Tax=Jannaschia faecimaris TaxID=1244108 RepID=A0A1H3QIX6_9RHOB|nr:uracil-DNA glycosylase family protein [Jannaschia faecimaris]SDZ13482.1 Uracil-DNA glycosylase [Jannaschia faecimaris]
MPLPEDLESCRLCSERFVTTHTAHRPKPVVWFRPGAPILVASQAPGLRAHTSGKPFDDPSGVRLRDWMGVGEETFWNKDHVAIVPMGFCFPGYDLKGSDLPPPRLCAATWRDAALAHVGQPQVRLLIGGYAQDWHLGKGRVTDRVRDWRALAPRVFCLPHPSWRNTGWIKRHPWFETDVLPTLRTAIQDALTR